MSKMRPKGSFDIFLAPFWSTFEHIFGVWKWPKLVCLDVFIGAPTSFCSFQPKIGALDQILWREGFLKNKFWLLFGPRRATFKTFRVWQMAQTGLSGCLHLCSNLFTPLPTKNMPYELICVAKMLFSAYFCPFLAPIGPYLGNSWFCKRAKLINLDVLCVVPTLFQPVSLNRGSHMAIFLKMPILALFWAFWGTFVRSKYIINVFSFTSTIQCYQD